MDSEPAQISFPIFDGALLELLLKAFKVFRRTHNVVVRRWRADKFQILIPVKRGGECTDLLERHFIVHGTSLIDRSRTINGSFRSGGSARVRLLR